MWRFVVFSQSASQVYLLKLQDFDNILTVNGQTAVEVDMESLEDKPWRKPGADITDYFNYGFTEETWAAYCNR